MALIDNLVSYWKMDEVSGSRADSQGSNTLTDNNTVGSAAGIINNGADFEASSTEYLNRSAQVWGVTNAWSWSFWLNPESFTGNPRVISFGNNSAADNVTIGLLVTNSKLFISLRNSSNVTFKDYSNSSTTFTTGSWFHVVVTWDGTDLLGYVNATAQTFTKTTDSAGSQSNSSRVLYLGSTTSATAPYDGIMDEVGLWSRAITSSEVTSLYNGGAGLAYPFSGSTIKSGFFNLM